MHVSTCYPSRQPGDSAVQDFHYTHASHRYLRELLEDLAWWRLSVYGRFTPLLEEASWENWSGIDVDGITLDGTRGIFRICQRLVGTRDLEFHQTDLVLALHEPFFASRTLERSSTSVLAFEDLRHSTRFQERFPGLIHSFYFFRVEIYFSLLCSLSSISIR